MSDNKSKRGLGRGLSALMSDVADVPDASEGAVKAADKPTR